MEIKRDFLEYVQDKLNDLIDNIGLCKKFGQHYIHTPNRKLYGGNPKEKDNREFIDKTVEEVFTDQTIIKGKKNKNDIIINEDENKKGISTSFTKLFFSKSEKFLFLSFLNFSS